MHLKKGIRTITVSYYQLYGSFDSKGAISSPSTITAVLGPGHGQSGEPQPSLLGNGSIATQTLFGETATESSPVHNLPSLRMSLMNLQIKIIANYYT